ncbi:MAG: solute carrier family 23 protein [Candidatus Eremiobacteraeota bacterium]|nr:solute carrier family 23 protein [Candidatus Eremiobacteraeota bacterium]
MEEGRILYPEDKIPLTTLIPMGLQHVLAMFGATVLAPLLMGFSPQIALFFSGIGTLIFIAVTSFKVPSYLGSSFAFIGPVLAITGGNAANIPYAQSGIAAAAILYGIAALATIRWGSHWIDRLMPPVVTGTVVAIIGLNLAASSMANAINPDFAITSARDVTNLTIASVTFLTAAFVAMYLRGFLRLLPILIGVIVGYTLAFALGAIDPAALAKMATAPWLGLPPFVMPKFSIEAMLVIAPVFVVLVAENKGHIAAISSCMKRDLTPHLGKAYLGDALASFVSAMGGGTPQTTYAENMGVMAITRVYSTYNFVAAAVIAIILGLCPKFGAAIQSIPEPVLGGITLILYGLITLMGVKIWVDAGIDFYEQKNLLVAGTSLIVATGLGVKGIFISGIALSGIALGTVLAIILNVILSLGGKVSPAGTGGGVLPCGEEGIRKSPQE